MTAEYHAPQISAFELARRVTDAQYRPRKAPETLSFAVSRQGERWELGILAFLGSYLTWTPAKLLIVQIKFYQQDRPVGSSVIPGDIEKLE